MTSMREIQRIIEYYQTRPSHELWIWPLWTLIERFVTPDRNVYRYTWTYEISARPHDSRSESVSFATFFYIFLLHLVP